MSNPPPEAHLSLCVSGEEGGRKESFWFSCLTSLVHQDMGEMADWQPERVQRSCRHTRTHHHTTPVRVCVCVCVCVCGVCEYLTAISMLLVSIQ